MNEKADKKETKDAAVRKHVKDLFAKRLNLARMKELHGEEAVQKFEDCLIETAIDFTTSFDSTMAKLVDVAQKTSVEFSEHHIADDGDKRGGVVDGAQHVLFEFFSDCLVDYAASYAARINMCAGSFTHGAVDSFLRCQDGYKLSSLQDLIRGVPVAIAGLSLEDVLGKRRKRHTQEDEKVDDTPPG